MTATIHILTPCMNMRSCIDRTILSVITQAGDFCIRYHVKGWRIDRWNGRTARLVGGGTGERAVPAAVAKISSSAGRTNLTAGFTMRSSRASATRRQAGMTG